MAATTGQAGENDSELRERYAAQAAEVIVVAGGKVRRVRPMAPVAVRVRRSPAFSPRISPMVIARCRAPGAARPSVQMRKLSRHPQLITGRFPQV